MKANGTLDCFKVCLVAKVYTLVNLAVGEGHLF